MIPLIRLEKHRSILEQAGLVVESTNIWPSGPDCQPFTRACRRSAAGRLLPHRPSDHAPVLARPVINLHSRCSNACPATLERHGKVASREVTVCCRNRDRFIAVYGARSLTATVQTCSVSCENVLVHPARTSDFRVALARQVFANSRQSAQHSQLVAGFPRRLNLSARRIRTGLDDAGGRIG
jgi:hypothetical protein